MQSVRRNQALAPGCGQLDEGGPGRGDGDLLPNHRADQQLLRVHRTRHPDARCGSDTAGQSWIGPLLFAYGAAGVAGNIVAGAAAARQTGRVLLMIALALLLTLALLAGFGH